MKEFKFILLFFIGLFVIYLLFRGSGGLLGGITNNSSSPSISTNDNNSSQEESVSNIYEQTYGTSQFKDVILLDEGRANRDERDREYVELEAIEDTVGSVTISGWKLVNATRDKTYTIPESPTIGYPHKSGNEGSVALSAGERAYVITDFSPIGTSFKTNKCTGYFKQKWDFSPSLDKECPEPEDKDTLEKFGLEDNEECIDFLKTISKCKDYQGLPNFDEDDEDKISNKCEEYIQEEVTYEGCVQNNVLTSDFFGSEWYLYLGVHFTIEEIWKDDDIILLLDGNGKFVDSISI